MNTDQIKAQAKQHGPTAGIVAAGVIAVGLMMPSVPSSPATNAIVTTAAGSAVPPQHTTPHGEETRLVSCGEMRGATGARLEAATPNIQPTDQHGSIRLGPGAKGHCTLVFAAPWTARPTCTVVGGRVAKLTDKDLVIEGAAELVTYDCGPGR